MPFDPTTPDPELRPQGQSGRYALHTVRVHNRLAEMASAGLATMADLEGLGGGGGGGDGLTEEAAEALFLATRKPRSYGAAGDGIADDTAAWQSAVDNCPVGGIIDGEGLTYVVTRVQLKSRITVQNATLRARPVATDTIVTPLTLGGDNDATLYENVTIRRLEIDGQRGQQTGGLAGAGALRSGIWIAGRARNILIEDVYVHHCAMDGLLLHRGAGNFAYAEPGEGVKQDITIRGSRFNWNRRHGGSGESMSRVRFIDCEFNDNGTNINGGATAGDQGATTGGTLYGNGWRFEESHVSDYVGDVVFERCKGLRNASSGSTYLSGPTAANDAAFTTRDTFRFVGGDWDAGAAGVVTDAIRFRVTSGNIGLGTYYRHVILRDVLLDGGIEATDVEDLRQDAAIPTAPILVRPHEFALFQGSPTLGTVGQVPAAMLADAVIGNLTTTVVIPAEWEAVDIDVWWANTSAATGNAWLRCDTGAITDGGALPSPPSGGNVAAAAPAQNTVTVTRLVSGRSVTPGLNGVELLRLGTSGSDTFEGGTVAVLALVFSRAS